MQPYPYLHMYLQAGALNPDISPLELMECQGPEIQSSLLKSMTCVTWAPRTQQHPHTERNFFFQTPTYPKRAHHCERGAGRRCLPGHSSTGNYPGSPAASTMEGSGTPPKNTGLCCGHRGWGLGNCPQCGPRQPGPPSWVRIRARTSTAKGFGFGG